MILILSLEGGLRRFFPSAFLGTTTSGRGSGWVGRIVTGRMRCPSASTVQNCSSATVLRKSTHLFGLVILLIWNTHILSFLAHIGSSDSDSSPLPLSQSIVDRFLRWVPLPFEAIISLRKRRGHDSLPDIVAGFGFRQPQLTSSPH
jgi:hypothetical protein